MPPVSQRLTIAIFGFEPGYKGVGHPENKIDRAIVSEKIVMTRLIDNLDLRSPAVLADIAYEERQNARWNWPEFPARAAHFIETGEALPRSRFNVAHLHAYGVGLGRLLFDLAAIRTTLTTETYEGGSILWKESRWMRFLRYFALAPQLWNPVKPYEPPRFLWDAGVDIDQVDGIVQ